MTRFTSTLLLAAGALLALASQVALGQEPLPPQQVFKYSTRADAERVYLDFAVLDGYYLYRGRFGFESGTAGIALGATAFPRGEIHKTSEVLGQLRDRETWSQRLCYVRCGWIRSIDHAGNRNSRTERPLLG